ncbi:Mce family protein [Gordonia hirsuta DSM 44140 = NBRC 16056]|uniref:Mce family protein n=1 Tax=Gordonia hirsuta DSM 44140 = NBRC 16056 TaxID=1121927 RepID=L7LAG4_9ACTN|nr:MlaD family protein [Gordonia hirsuta]GAC58130.1 Mce family protein [Gordonia hirsuta DSM 44140 = NBRC 16056]
MSNERTSAQRRRRLTAALAVLLVLAVTAAGAAWLAWPRVSSQILTRSVCADFTDSAGLYKGNSVALMGLGVGQVAAIEPRESGVRVRLEIDRELALPADVGAVIIDGSIVADRRVEFDRPYSGGPTLSGDTCIPDERTKTPRGVSESFAAVDGLLDDAMGSDGVLAELGGTDDLAEVMDVLDKNFSGKSDKIVALMRQMVTAQGNPATVDAAIRRILENSDTLLTEVEAQWPDVERVIRTVNGAGLAFTAFSEEFTGTLTSAVRFVPVLSRNVERFGDRILGVVDLITPWVRVLAPFATRLAQAVAQLPGLATVTDHLFDPDSGAFRIGWTPPTVPVSATEATAVCTVLGRPDDCASSRAARSGLIQLIMGSGR